MEKVASVAFITSESWRSSPEKLHNLATKIGDETELPFFAIFVPTHTRLGKIIRSFAGIDPVWQVSNKPNVRFPGFSQRTRALLLWNEIQKLKEHD